MKAKHMLFVAAVGLLAASCIDEKEYNPQIPQEPDQSVDYAMEINPNKTFTHPGLIVTQADFDRAKNNVGSYPWNEAFDALENARWRNDGGYPRVEELPSAMGKHWLMRGSDRPGSYIFEFGIYWDEAEDWGYDLGDSPTGNYGVMYQDCSTAWSNAVYWKMTGDTDAADVAIEILNAWAVDVAGIIGDENAALIAAESAYAFANIAELMRDYTGWVAADKAVFDKWIEDVHVERLMDFLDTHLGYNNTHTWANWDLTTMNGLMAIGIYLDRADIYNHVLDYVTYGQGNGNFRRFIWHIHEPVAGEDDIQLGQTQESGRDQGHNLSCIQVAGAICRMAWNQGDDLYGYDNNRFLKGAEYVSKYNMGMHLDAEKGLNLTYPFEAGFVAAGIYHADFGPDGRGKIATAYLVTYEHYKKHKNVDSRYLRMMAKTPIVGGEYDLDAAPDEVLIEPETIDHNNGAGYGHGTLLFTEE